jgi:hypothetical protein
MRDYYHFLNTVGSSDILIQAVNDAKFRNDELKRKNGSDSANFLSNKRTTIVPNTNVSFSANNSNDRYKQGLDFVE